MQFKSISDWKNHINCFDFGPPLSSVGTSIYFQSQLHGNETMGTLVLSNLISFLNNLEKGSIKESIRIVPRANPFSWNTYQYTRNGLFDTTSGDNWNRIFDWNAYQDKAKKILNENKSISKENLFQKLRNLSIKQQNTSCLKDFISNKLFELSIGYNFIVDVHTPENGIEHLYCSSYADVFPKFEVPYIVEYGMPTLNTFDEAHNKFNKVFFQFKKTQNYNAVTLEIDSNIPAEKKTIDQWTERIIKQLIDFKIIENNKIHTDKTATNNNRFIGNMINFNSHISGIQFHHFKLGETISSGDKIFEIRPFSNSIENEVVYSDSDCIPLCLRKHNIVNSGNWIVRALKVNRTEK